LQALAWRIDIPRVEGSLPIVVFNPHAWPTRVNVELESDGLGGADELEDDTGRRVDVQTVTSLASVGEGRRRISFDADLPALGYRVYRTTLPALPTPERGEGFTTANILESALWRLEFDASSGELVSLWDKREQCEVLAGPARAVVIEDPSDTWGHGVLRFQDEAGAFKATRIELVERGPVKSTLRVESAFGRSRLVQDYTVFAELEPIEVRVLVDWREQRRVLKLRFPVNVRFQRATYEIPFGRIERPANGEEEPGQGWIDLSGVHRSSGQLYGMSVLNDAKQSYDVHEREISLTVLRSPAYAHHDPHRPQDWEALSYLDQGIQRFTYALLPHTDGWETSGTVQRAAELNQRPIALIDTTHKGTLPGSCSFVSLEPANVAITALKAAEDGDGDLVLRCYETGGRSTLATLTFFGRRLEFEIGRFEIKTLKLPKDGGTRVLETDLLERPLRPVEPEERPAWTRLSRSHSR
jgi:alpha-mannosidase